MSIKPITGRIEIPMQFHIVLDIGTNISVALQQSPSVISHVVAGQTLDVAIDTVIKKAL